MVVIEIDEGIVVVKFDADEMITVKRFASEQEVLDRDGIRIIIAMGLRNAGYTGK